MSLNIDQITKFTEQLCQDTKQLAAGDQKARVRLICVANKLAQALENPQETFLRLWLLDVSVNETSEKRNGRAKEKVNGGGGPIEVFLAIYQDLTMILPEYYQSRLASCLRLETVTVPPR